MEQSIIVEKMIDSAKYKGRGRPRKLDYKHVAMVHRTEEPKATEADKKVFWFSVAMAGMFASTVLSYKGIVW